MSVCVYMHHALARVSMFVYGCVCVCSRAFVSAKKYGHVHRLVTESNIRLWDLTEHIYIAMFPTIPNPLLKGM